MSQIRFVAWPGKELCRHFNLLTDRWCECVMDVCIWGVVVKEDEGHYHTRRLSDGIEWTIPKDYVELEKVIRTPEQLREFEKEFPHWWEAIEKQKQKKRRKKLEEEE